MPVVEVNGISLSYRDTGAGAPVVLVMGSGGGGRVWHLHQVPALTAAGHRVITVDNRGIPPTDVCADGFTVADMAADLAGLLAHLGIERARFVGTSMGADVVAELALARPELVVQAVLMAAKGRSDAFRTALALAERELDDLGIELPARYRAAVQALQNLSATTLADDRRAADWLDVLELAPRGGRGLRAQQRLEPMPDRLADYTAIRVPCHVIAFADDLVTPPGAGRELAAAIPGATFELIEACGHYGYLEDPAVVNAALLRFFATERAPATADR